MPLNPRQSYKKYFKFLSMCKTEKYTYFRQKSINQIFKLQKNIFSTKNN